MSTFFKRTKNPDSGKWEEALWMDDYFGQHHYGVEFPDGTIVDPNRIKLETTNESLIRVAPHPKREQFFGKPESIQEKKSEEKKIDSIGVFRGRPISDMSREELLVFAAWAVGRIINLEKLTDKHLELDLKREALL